MITVYFFVLLNVKYVGSCTDVRTLNVAVNLMPGQTCRATVTLTSLSKTTLRLE